MATAKQMFTMTVKEMREGLQESRTVIVPIGITEQHGNHLPLSVDVHNAVEIASRASGQCGCFVAPALHYAFSGGTLPGTINLSPQVYSLMLMDICRSLVVQGFRNIILLLGHGGTENTRATHDAAEMFQRLSPDLSGISVSVVPFWELSPTYMRSMDEGDFHAARYETSMMLYWHPELVKMDEAVLDPPAVVKDLREDPDGYLVKTKALDHPFVEAKLTQRTDMHVGVMGALDDISPELGRQVAEEASAALADFFRQLEAANP